MHKFLIFLAVFCFLICPGFAAALDGKVIKVADGDTITILIDGHQQQKIRLYGIDTPERRQAYGSRAKDFTTAHLAGRQVHVQDYGKDRYDGKRPCVMDYGEGRAMNKQAKREIENVKQGNLI